MKTTLPLVGQKVTWTTSNKLPLGFTSKGYSQTNPTKGEGVIVKIDNHEVIFLGCNPCPKEWGEYPRKLHYFMNQVDIQVIN
jgi:hypothetical protein